MQSFLKFSTDALPERDRIAIWSDVFGRYIIRSQLRTVGSEAFSQHATLRQLGSLSLASTACSGFYTRRTSVEIADGNDNLNLIINLTGIAEYRQLGRETVVQAREAILISSGEEVEGLYPGPSRALVVSAPRQAIAALAGDPEAVLCRPLPQTDALRLLISYVQSAETITLDSPGLGQAFATHLQDLVTLAIGGTRDGEHVASRRGLRAARLTAIKVDIGKALGRDDLSIGALALRHGVTSRYIQKLFESEGTTFTEYVIEHRLLDARRMLTDPAFADNAIGDIALRCGFGDLPYFTRSFRRRFGMTPTDARQQATHGRGGGTG
ncbi:AraC family transcriptional regulator [Bradyrhizobium sp. Cp5.3]|uniref:AraC family transcriptional regulator n=1 Tax=Bradyrhizobium sp. Cp5.3 TaxID=443598 RepID=UPI0003F68462|nr:AraC family transcriptional regulator [Bradyrhizobium sp. Cp5.3]